jgi:hypothetical protein
MKNKELLPAIVKDFSMLKPEYQAMTDFISKNLPAIKASTENFNKTQSQFMDNMLTVAHPTPLRNVRQILAEMTKTDQALREAYIGCSKKEVQIKIKQRELEKATDSLERELVELDILELKNSLDVTSGYIQGALRKQANYIEQYESILAGIGKKTFTEEDFENEEEEYHIKTAFNQGVTAARARGGIIDEGNLIYVTQLGINGSLAARLIQQYLAHEEKLMGAGIEPNFELHLRFLNDMAKKFAGCSKELADKKFMTGKVSEIATLGFKKS